jgi:hypothetical protein
MATVKYEPVPKGYRRFWIIDWDGTGKNPEMRLTRKGAEVRIDPSYGDRVIPIDVPLSALRPAKAKKSGGV